MTIAIYGAASTGKTSAANALALQSGRAIRCCGAIIKDLAGRLGMAPHDLPLSQHSSIDEETREWVMAAASPTVVEGRYLDQVLSNLRCQIFLVELVASPEVRLARWRSRDNLQIDVSEIVRADDLDRKFRFQAYRGILALTPNLTISTDCRSVDEVAQLIWNAANA